MPHFDLALVLHGQYHDWLTAGLLVSLKLAATTFVFALPPGVAVALLRLAPHAALRALGATYVEGIRNVPLLAHLLASSSRRRLAGHRIGSQQHTFMAARDEVSPKAPMGGGASPTLRCRRSRASHGGTVAKP